MADNRKTIGTIMAVLIGLCAVSNVFLLTRSEVGVIPKVGTVLNLFALTSAAVYCISGYRKQSQVYYRGFFPVLCDPSSDGHSRHDNGF